MGCCSPLLPRSSKEKRKARRRNFAYLSFIEGSPRVGLNAGSLKRGAWLARPRSAPIPASSCARARSRICWSACTVRTASIWPTNLLDARQDAGSPPTFARQDTLRRHLSGTLASCSLPFLTWDQPTRHTFASRWVFQSRGRGGVHRPRKGGNGYSGVTPWLKAASGAADDAVSSEKMVLRD